MDKGLFEGVNINVTWFDYSDYPDYGQMSHQVNKHSTSVTSDSLAKKIDHFVNAVTSFSTIPLRAIFYFGFLIALVSICFAGVLLFNRFFLYQPGDGWTSVMVSIWVLGGMVISFVGMIGVYLAKVLSETKQRPNVIVKDVYGHRK